MSIGLCSSGTRILVPAVLAVLFVGVVANAAEKDNKSTVASANDTGVAKVSVNNGPWVGVIENIQDVDTETLKQAETGISLSEKYAAIGMVIGAIAQVTLGTPNSSFAGWSIGRGAGSSGSISERNDPRLYLVTFKDEKTNKLENVLVFDKIQWNVGDKIKATRNEVDSSKIDVVVVEMGEISRYAAEKAVEKEAAAASSKKSWWSD